MELSGEHRIKAPRESVWQAMNDPAVLAICIPGCEAIEPQGENEFGATVTTKVGPVKAKFKGKVTLSDLNPPLSYRISGEGQGGPAGFAKGGALVELAEDGEETILTYQVDATVGGKLAQIGQRFIDGTAKKLAAEFFQALNNHLSGPEPITEVEAAPEPAQGLAPKIWIPVLIAGALILMSLIALL